ncbi:MAG: serine/threonine-protein phosphatase [Anaerolineae bacterium]|nr:serine/threonine-protein phosphatase [Anaerolineae bacterium]MCB0255843.1 serine/threonine-protein phosphatase [Anaerolineae bacterium]
MGITLHAVGSKDVGKVRDLNEDEFYVKVVQSSDEPPVGLFIVADGMGGTAGGELASEWAVKTLRTELQDLFVPNNLMQTRKLSMAEIAATSGAVTNQVVDFAVQDRIQRAVQHANEVVVNYARNRPEKAGDTGTTVTMAVVKESIAYIANVGDSRTYLFSQGQLRPITEDHSLVGSLVKVGQLQPDEVYAHPQRNLIYRSLGGKPVVEVDQFVQPLQPGDQLLLCSDGLWEMVRDPDIAAVLRDAPSPAAACDRLIEAANACGGEDNISAVVVWMQ